MPIHPSGAQRTGVAADWWAQDTCWVSLLHPRPSLPALLHFRIGAGRAGSNPQGFARHSGTSARRPGHIRISLSGPLSFPAPCGFRQKTFGRHFQPLPGQGFFHQGASWAAAAKGRTRPARPLGTHRLCCPKVALGLAYS